MYVVAGMQIFAEKRRDDKPSSREVCYIGKYIIVS